jgi:cytoskeletal protein CcmA (bactofilin family)
MTVWLEKVSRIFGKGILSDDVIAVLGKGCSFKGDLTFEGSMRIDGYFEGNITGTGTLVIGEGAHIEANIDVGSLHISGEVTGTIQVKEKIKIYDTGKLIGNLKAMLLAIEEGGMFEGHSLMISDGAGNYPGSIKPRIV